MRPGRPRSTPQARESGSNGTKRPVQRGKRSSGESSKLAAGDGRARVGSGRQPGWHRATDGFVGSAGFRPSLEQTFLGARGTYAIRHPEGTCRSQGSNATRWSLFHEHSLPSGYSGARSLCPVLCCTSPFPCGQRRCPVTLELGVRTAICKWLAAPKLRPCESKCPNGIEFGSLPTTDSASEEDMCMPSGEARRAGQRSRLAREISGQVPVVCRLEVGLTRRWGELLDLRAFHSTGGGMGIRATNRPQ